MGSLLYFELSLSRFSRIIWNNQESIYGLTQNFIFIVSRTKYMSKTMQKLKAEAESKKEQRLKLEKWTQYVIDGVHQEQDRRSERRAVPAPILGQQNEVAICVTCILE
jgi:protein involved in sex pheromone biosynthesis